MRPDRVYALEELSEAAEAETRFGRILRIAETGSWSAWLGMFRQAGDFAAADSAFLSALAPHLAIAMNNFAKLEETRLRAAIADDLLTRANLSWRVYAPDGRSLLVASNAASEAAPMAPRESARVAMQVADTPVLCGVDQGEVALAIPVASGGLAANAPAGVTIVTRRPSGKAGTPAIFERMWSLTPSEARLVLALVAGHSLTESAARLGISVDTARHYSKRIYAKTGASGQADLVRRALTSVAALC